MRPLSIHHGLTEFAFAVDHSASGVGGPPALRLLAGPMEACAEPQAARGGVPDIEQKVNKNLSCRPVRALGKSCRLPQGIFQGSRTVAGNAPTSLGPTPRSKTISVRMGPRAMLHLRRKEAVRRPGSKEPEGKG